MSFGMVAASYFAVPPTNGLVQQNSGLWTGTTMSVSLPSVTNPSSVIALFAAGNNVVSTPSGWILRESQVNWMGHYLFTCPGGASSWNITTNNGAGAWYVAEIGGGYDVSASAHDTNGYGHYTTPALVPTAGNRLIIASLGGLSDYGPYTLDAWTDNFSEVADICYPSEDYPMQAVAVRTVAADGMAGYLTTGSYSIAVSPSVIIAAFSV